MAREPEGLRDRTDRGKLGDKVDFPDPATAPLGTDDEAAGRPADRQAVAAARADQEAIAASVRNRETDSLAPQGAGAVSDDASEQRRPMRNWVIPAAVGFTIAMLVLLAIWLTFPA